jgi:hypothetical protein
MKDDTRSQSRRKGRYAVRGKVSERWWAADGVEMTDAGSRAVDGTLAFLNAGDWLEPAVRRNHQRCRFGVSLLRREGRAKEALRLSDAPITLLIQLLAGAQPSRCSS